MIATKYKALVFAFFMSLIMSGVMSLVISLFNTGINEDGIIVIWLQAWLFSFVIALPTILMVSPIITWLVTLVIKPNDL